MRSGWFLSKGKWYYLGAANDGSMKTGWQLVNGSWYYMNPGNGDMAANQWIGNYYVGGSGAMLTNQWIGNYYVDGSGKWVPGKTKATAQWILSGNRWWYRHADGGYTRNGWELINGSWYYFDNAGWMLSNQWIGNYYVGGSGAMLTNQWIGNYYVDASGKWVPGKTKVTAQWIQSGNRWWYRHADGGYTRNGWELINGSWYYFDNAGWMLANQWIGNYYVGGSGAMLTDTWIGNYYVDGSGKWVPDAKKDQHTHKWVAETTVITHPAETHQELVKEAWTEEIPHEEEGHYEATVPGHWEYELVPAEGYEEEYETLQGTTDKRFVVTKRAYTKSTWVEPKTVECNEIGFEVKTPMYREEERIICGGCGRDVTDDYKTDSLESHINTEALKGNDNCASTYSDYRMVQYDTRNVVYPATYVVDKEKYVEKIQHDAEYKTVVDRDEWTETITKNVCSECGAVQ